MKKSLGIYVHIPFCVSKCRYCDFCSFAGKDEGDMSAYIGELCRRIERAEGVESYEVDTVYFGGGTPSLMRVGELERLLGTINSRFSVSDNAELTLECNPATADRQYFADVRSLGINRLSMGLQSALDTELKMLGRIHTASDFVKTYNDARAAGFDNISADLMYGIPDQSLDSFEYSLGFLTNLSPEHISAYGLTVEEGTYFHKHKDELALADGDGQYEMYMLLSDYLRTKGYVKYEISNFSREGGESRHNLRYWNCGEYLGFGVAAHSYFGGNRFGNSRDVRAFLEGKDIVEESTIIDADEQRAEYVMLGLRLASGIDVYEYRERFGKELSVDTPTVQKYVTSGLMSFDGRRLRFTDKGFFVSNAIITDILELI